MTKKILMITSSFPRYEGDYFGPWILEYCRELIKQNVEVIVVAPRVAESPLKELSTDKLTIARFNYWWPWTSQKLVHPPGMIPQLKSNPFRLLQIIPLLRSYYITAKRIIEQERIDIIHCQWLIPAGYIGALLKQKYNIPLVVTSQGAEVYLNKYHPFSWFTRRTIKRTDKLLPVSKQMAVRAIDFGATKDQIEVIPNTVNIEKFSRNKISNFRTQHNLPANAIVLLTVRRLVPEKRVMDLINAFLTLKKKEDTYLVIGGDGPEKERLKSRVESSKTDKILFLGFVNNADLSEIYSASDIYILSSEQEGLSLSLLEAMASGCMVISTTNTGAEDVIVHEENGFLYESGNIKELTALINHVVSLPQQNKKQIIKAAHDRIIESYSTESMIKKWNKIYNQV